MLNDRKSKYHKSLNSIKEPIQFITSNHHKHGCLWCLSGLSSTLSTLLSWHSKRDGWQTCSEKAMTSEQASMTHRAVTIISLLMLITSLISPWWSPFWYRRHFESSGYLSCVKGSPHQLYSLRTGPCGWCPWTHSFDRKKHCCLEYWGKVWRCVRRSLSHFYYF